MPSTSYIRLLHLFFLMIRRPPRSTLFPYTTALPILPASTGARKTTTIQPACATVRANRARNNRLAATGAASTSRKSSRSEEHTSELQSLAYLVCRLLLEKKKNTKINSNNDNTTSSD